MNPGAHRSRCTANAPPTSTPPETASLHWNRPDRTCGAAPRASRSRARMCRQAAHVRVGAEDTYPRRTKTNRRNAREVPRERAGGRSSAAIIPGALPFHHSKIHAAWLRKFASRWLRMACGESPQNGLIRGTNSPLRGRAGIARACAPLDVLAHRRDVAMDSHERNRRGECNSSPRLLIPMECRESNTNCHTSLRELSRIIRK